MSKRTSQSGNPAGEAGSDRSQSGRSGAPETPDNHFSVFNEKPLHADLKAWYARPGDRFEVAVDGFVIDILRGESLIEIQTRSFSSIKPKLTKLVLTHPVRLVYPVAYQKWITRQAGEGPGILSRRRSPKRGGAEDLFSELVSFPQLVLNSNLSIEVLMIEEEEIRRHDDVKGWRRKGWLTLERRLVKVIDSRIFEGPDDYGDLLPSNLNEPFTTRDLALTLNKPLRLAQRMVYCLRLMKCLAICGKKGRAIQYCQTGG